VSTISELYARFRHLIHEGAKFLTIGAIGFAVTLAVANALHPIGKYKAITIATIVATVITYLGNRYWTFRHREGTSQTRDSILFFVLNGVGLLIYYGCIGLTELFGLSGRFWYNVALIIGTGLGTLFRFWSYRKWVWTAPGGADAPAIESDEERAHDMAAVAAAAPVDRNRFGSASANGYRPGSASPNGSSAGSGTADGASDGSAAADGASATPRSHARPGRPSLWHAPAGRGEEQGNGGHTPASHRRTQ
jgi:putative flippase GtrA